MGSSIIAPAAFAGATANSWSFLEHHLESAGAEAAGGDEADLRRSNRDDAQQEARIEAAGSAWRPLPGGAWIRTRLKTATGYAWF